MKRRLSDSYPEALVAYEEHASGLHPSITHFIEVFERDGEDTQRTGRDGEYGELWMVDEDGLGEAVDGNWFFQTLDTIGFDRDELARLEAEEAT